MFTLLSAYFGHKEVILLMKPFTRYTKLTKIQKLLYLAISKNDKYTIIAHRLVALPDHKIHTEHNIKKIDYYKVSKENKYGTVGVFRIVNIPPNGKIIYNNKYLIDIGVYEKDLFVVGGIIHREIEHVDEIIIEIKPTKNIVGFTEKEWRAIKFEIDSLFMLLNKEGDFDVESGIQENSGEGSG